MSWKDLALYFTTLSQGRSHGRTHPAVAGQEATLAAAAAGQDDLHLSVADAVRVARRRADLAAIQWAWRVTKEPLDGSLRAFKRTLKGHDELLKALDDAHRDLEFRDPHGPLSRRAYRLVQFFGAVSEVAFNRIVFRILSVTTPEAYLIAAGLGVMLAALAHYVGVSLRQLSPSGRRSRLELAMPILGVSLVLAAVVAVTVLRVAYLGSLGKPVPVWIGGCWAVLNAIFLIVGALAAFASHDEADVERIVRQKATVQRRRARVERRLNRLSARFDRLRARYVKKWAVLRWMGIAEVAEYGLGIGLAAARGNGSTGAASASLRVRLDADAMFGSVEAAFGPEFDPTPRPLEEPLAYDQGIHATEEPTWPRESPAPKRLLDLGQVGNNGHPATAEVR